MNTIMANMAKTVGEQIVEQAPKYGAKLLLAIPVEVGTFFASQAIIKWIQEAKEEKAKEVCEPAKEA